MVKIWQQFLNWLYSTPSRKKDVLTDDLYDLDVQEIAHELHLNEEARRLGVVGMPSQGSTQLTGIEQQIVHRIENARLDFINWGNRRLGLLNDNLAKLDVSPLVHHALQVDKEFERAARTLLAEEASHVRHSAELAHNRQRELQEFKTQNGLSRDAYEQRAPLLTYGWLFLFILVEGSFNAALFAAGLSTGLLGGLGAASALAALNVGVAFALGRQTTYMHHRNLLQKIRGWMAALAFLATMVGIGLGIAHFRDALVAELENPEATALHTLVTTPFSLAGITSWGLFGLSLFFAVVAFAKGRAYDDPYPGYGPRTRAAAQARDDYQANIADVRQRLESLKQDTLAGLEKCAGDVKTLLTRQESEILQKQMAEERLQTALQKAQQGLSALIKQFRTENEMCRQGIPLPAYFLQEPRMSTVRLPDFKVKESRKKLKEQEQLALQLTERLQSLRAAVQSAFLKEYDLLQPLDSALADRVLNTNPESVTP